MKIYINKHEKEAIAMALDHITREYENETSKAKRDRYKVDFLNRTRDGLIRVYKKCLKN